MIQFKKTLSMTTYRDTVVNLKDGDETPLLPQSKEKYLEKTYPKNFKIVKGDSAPEPEKEAPKPTQTK